MIKIFIKRQNKIIKNVKVSGHGIRKRGEDIVCAGVSAVTQTALSGLLHYGKDNVKYRTKDGFLEINVMNLTEPHQKTIFEAILTTMVLGLRGIEKEHPEKVRVVIEDG